VQDWTLLFQHIPKTAGTSVSKALVRQYDPDRIFQIRVPDPEGPIYTRHHGTRQEFDSLPMQQRNRFRLVLGHFRFGLHESIDNECRYITILRRPIERILSQYRQNMRKLAREKGDVSVITTLEEFCVQRPRAVNNHQLRFISNARFKKSEDEKALRLALDNLRDYYMLVGTQERIDEFMVLLGWRMGWPDLRCGRYNVSRSTFNSATANPESLAALKERNRLDSLLFDEADRLLDEAIEAYGGGFADALDAYRQSVIADHTLSRPRFAPEPDGSFRHLLIRWLRSWRTFTGKV
jgi:hypothetical protein